MALTRSNRRKRIKFRIRKRIRGNADIPRLAVYRSNKEIYAQLIDDESGKTLMSVSSRDKGIAGKKSVTKIEKSGLVGKAIAEKAMEGGIKEVVFDRSGYLYHGRVRQLAEAAREGGLKF